MLQIDPLGAHLPYIGTLDEAVDPVLRCALGHMPSCTSSFSSPSDRWHVWSALLFDPKSLSMLILVSLVHIV